MNRSTWSFPDGSFSCRMCPRSVPAPLAGTVNRDEPEEKSVEDRSFSGSCTFPTLDCKSLIPGSNPGAASSEIKYLRAGPVPHGFARPLRNHAGGRLKFKRRVLPHITCVECKKRLDAASAGAYRRKATLGVADSTANGSGCSLHGGRSEDLSATSERPRIKPGRGGVHTSRPRCSRAADVNQVTRKTMHGAAPVFPCAARLLVRQPCTRRIRPWEGERRRSARSLVIAFRPFFVSFAAPWGFAARAQAKR